MKVKINDGGGIVFIICVLTFLSCTKEEKEIVSSSVIVITIDALRADGLSLYGNPSSTSPELDRIAGEGVYFHRAIAPFVCTTPAMAALMTGLNPYYRPDEGWQFGSFFGLSRFSRDEVVGGMNPDLQTLAEILRDNGYHTIGFSTNPHLAEKTHFNQGFEEYTDFQGYFDRNEEERIPLAHACSAPAPVVLKLAEDKLREIEEPFFLWIHLMDVHFPYLAPVPYNRLFDRGFLYLDDLILSETYQALIMEQYGEKSYRDFKTLEELGITKKALTDHMKGLYLGEIRLVDDSIGKFYDFLQDQDLADNTLLIITSDHGEEFMEHGCLSHHGLTGAKHELINIPLIMLFPDGDPLNTGTGIDSQVRLVDLAPTIVDFLGLTDSVPPMEGKSLLSVIRGEEEEGRLGCISAPWFETVVNDRWKYIRMKDPEREELFDRQVDPGETRNLAEAQPEKIKEMRRLYQEFSRKMESEAPSRVSSAPSDPSPSPVLNSIERDRLRALGYAQ